jgi:hypothetical protein
MTEDKIENQEPNLKREGVTADENAVCEVCGKFGAYKFDDQNLCADCYQEKGSCCSAEFEKVDGE